MDLLHRGVEPVRQSTGGGDGGDLGPSPLSFYLADGEVTAPIWLTATVSSPGLGPGSRPEPDSGRAPDLPAGGLSRIATYHGGELSACRPAPGRMRRPDAGGLDFVYQGRRVSLPVAEPELFRALGRPLERLSGRGLIAPDTLATTRLDRETKLVPFARHFSWRAHGPRAVRDRVRVLMKQSGLSASGQAAP